MKMIIDMISSKNIAKTYTINKLRFNYARRGRRAKLKKYLMCLIDNESQKLYL